MTSSRGRAPDAVALVDAAGRELARRTVRRTVAWWRTPTPAGRTREQAVVALVRALAAYAQEVESGAVRHEPPPPKRPDVLLDQLAVMTYDLALAVREAGAAATAGRAAAECLLTAYEVDPRPFDGALLDAVLAGDLGAHRDAVGGLPRQRE